MNYAAFDYETSIRIAQSTETTKVLIDLYKFWRTKAKQTGSDYVRLMEAIAGNRHASCKLLRAIYQQHGVADGFNIVVLLALSQNPTVPDDIRENLEWVAKNPLFPNIIRYELMVSV